MRCYVVGTRNRTRNCRHHLRLAAAVFLANTLVRRRRVPNGTQQLTTQSVARTCWIRRRRRPVVYVLPSGRARCRPSSSPPPPPLRRPPATAPSLYTARYCTPVASSGPTWVRPAVCDSFPSGHTRSVHSAAALRTLRRRRRRTAGRESPCPPQPQLSPSLSSRTVLPATTRPNSFIMSDVAEQMKDGSNIILTASPFSNIGKPDVLKSVVDVPATVSIGGPLPSPVVRLSLRPSVCSPALPPRVPARLPVWSPRQCYIMSNAVQMVAPFPRPSLSQRPWLKVRIVWPSWKWQRKKRIVRWVFSPF